MLDIPMRLVIAYGLIALMVLAAVGLAWWRAHNSQRRRDERARSRLAERYRQRSEIAATEAER